MAFTLAWRPLPLPRSTGVPVLLASLDVGTADYAIRVTDMAHVWTESLDRKAICMRGWSENTSIDPSDTAENMAKFLTSLRSALDLSQAGHHQTSLGISPAADDGLTLKITCELPGLQPLKWPIHLKRSPPSAVATDVVFPLVQAHHARNREVESLVTFLQNKDAVIAKLVDKLEATGTGLEHVFTSLSGRKKVSRSAAGEKVRGLAPFDRRRWIADLEESEEGMASASGLVQDVFGGVGLQYQTLVEVDQSPELDRWWHGFKATSQAAPRPHPETVTPKHQTPSPSARSTNARNADDDGDDDDFQVQSTPPHLMSARKRTATRNQPLPDDASTEDEDVSSPPDTHHPPEAVPETQRQPGDTKLASRLGTIGGKARPAPARSPSPRRNLSVIEEPSANTGGDGSETASEADDDAATASSAADSPPRPPPSPKDAVPREGVLGRIGGQKPRPVVVGGTGTSGAGHADEAETAGAAPRSPRKLGVIGKIGGATSSPSANDAGSDAAGRGRQATRNAAGDGEQRPRETSEERADRRREELKSDLERKAAAGPAKKKRKF